MAETEPLPPNLDGLVARLVEELYDPAKLKRLELVIAQGLTQGKIVADATETAAKIASGVLEELIKPLWDITVGWMSGWVMSLVVERAFDVDVDNIAFARLSASGNRKEVARRLTGKMIEGLTGGSTSIEPSPNPAAAYLNVVLSQTLEAWAIGAMVEVGSAIHPELEQIQLVGDIGARVVGALGIGDSSSRVLRPYIDRLVVEPLRRYLDNTYRGELLGTGDAVRQFLRGNWTRAQLEKELGEQGWSSERIAAHINAQQKFLSPSDIDLLVYRNYWSDELGMQELRDQGFDDAHAKDVLRLEGVKRLAALDGAIASAIVSAYASREIDDQEFDRWLKTTTDISEERALVKELAVVRRAVNVPRIAKGDVEAAVRKGILPMAAYRRWLERRGFGDDDVLTLELLLRSEIDKETKIEQHRKEAEAERAAEKQARDQERVVRKAAIEAERALHRRGAESDLERAAVRGLVPFSRLEEVLREKYDEDTVALLLGLVEDERETFLAQQQRAEDARQRAARRNLDVGALEQAVLAGVLTLDEFARHPALATLDAPDRQILIATLRARQADLKEAQTKRDEAERRVARRSIDLGRFELLVRRGHRTLAQYDHLLTSLEFDDAARVAMRELLELQIADDQAAAKTRAEAAAKLRAKGLSLEQIRRAVVLKISSIEDFARVLVAQGFTTDAQAVLLAELRHDVDEADAARARRRAADAPSGGPRLPLSTVRRAARLGVISPDVYEARLRADKLSDEEIALDLDLLLLEIADVQAARARRDAAEPAAAAKGLSLADLVRAVKHGVKSLAEYRAALITTGFDDDAVTTQVRVLADELEATQAAKARRQELTGALDAAGAPLAVLEDQVRSGALTIDRFIALLAQKGIASDEVALVAGLLVDELDAAA